MEEKYCNVCGAKLENNAKFCIECGNTVEGNSTIQPENKKIPPPTNSTEVKPQNAQTNTIPRKKKSLIGVIFKIILILVLIGGIGYGVLWIYGEFFSINTPPIYPNVNTYVSDSSEEEDNTDFSNSSQENKIYDTDEIDGITKIEYKMSDIVGNWYVTFKNYVSLEGETIGFYQSYSNVKIEKIDDINFSATFDVQTAEINGEEIDVGKQIFYGKLENNKVNIEMNCDSDFLYTGTSYNANFLPEVKTGKLSGISEVTTSKLVEGHNMTYRVVTEFVQE